MPAPHCTELPSHDPPHRTEPIPTCHALPRRTYPSLAHPGQAIPATLGRAPQNQAFPCLTCRTLPFHSMPSTTRPIQAMPCLPNTTLPIAAVSRSTMPAIPSLTCPVCAMRSGPYLPCLSIASQMSPSRFKWLYLSRSPRNCANASFSATARRSAFFITLSTRR